MSVIVPLVPHPRLATVLMGLRGTTLAAVIARTNRNGELPLRLHRFLDGPLTALDWERLSTHVQTQRKRDPDRVAERRAYMRQLMREKRREHADRERAG